MDINNNLIIDIHYPNRNIVALLVHNDYADKLRSQLQQFKVTLKDDFNPCDPKILRDLQYANASIEKRTNITFIHHCNRMKRALKFIRTPVKFAVARYFYAQGWISKQALQETLPSSRHNRESESDPLQIEVLLSNASYCRFSPKTGVLQGSILSPYL